MSEELQVMILIMICNLGTVVVGRTFPFIL